MNKKLIFTITPGRSGSNFLSNLFKLSDDVDSVHEAEPQFSSYLRKILKNPDFGEKFWNEIKLPAIAKKKKNIYMESSHVFCKGFVESFLDTYVGDFSFIALMRDIRKIAISYYQIGSIPGRGNRILKYTLHPNDPNTITNLTCDLEKLHDYQLCYWHTIEMFHHIDKWIDEDFVYPVWLDDLKNEQSLITLMENLKIPINDDFISKWGSMKDIKVNNKPQNKKNPVPNDIEELEISILDRLDIDIRFLEKYKIQ